MPKKFLTVAEVAKIIGVTPLTVRNWDKKGHLVAYRNPVNNYRLYDVNDIESLIKKIDRSKFEPIEPVRPVVELVAPKKIKIEDLEA